ncbi:hypothetical protein GCM10027055_19860 [Janibacter alkaliphilus]|uniref:Uncharacterized protein YukE n=1 Tax=Janibacter alkaliphilus TaxID=1069963 RepID=A0A852X5V4_9MICO|nr:Mbeg1-like protein [Janibacter alkaliphilus]NYG35564.1 uncharacterized protein YukE [Janibacter alkaliphilus]
MSLTHGAHAERLKGIAGQLRVQSRRTVAVRESGSGRLGVLQGAWEGEDLESFARRWQVSARALDECAERLESAAALMLEEADQQVAASDGAEGGTQGLGITMGIGPGAPTGPSGIAPAGPSGPAPTGPPDDGESEGSTFDEDIRGTEGKPEDKDLWYLAHHSYGPDNGLYEDDLFYDEQPDLPEGYEVVDPVEELGINPELLSDEHGMQAEVYRTPDGGYVVAYRGSDQGFDWWTNARQGAVGGGAAYEDAMELAVAVDDASGGNVTFTGHSLGGGQAAAAAMATGQPAVTFDAAGVHETTAAQAAEMRGDGSTQESVLAETSEGQIRTYRMDTDILTETAEDDGLLGGAIPDAQGTPITLDTPQSDQGDAVAGTGAVVGGVVGGVAGLFDGDLGDVADDVGTGAEVGRDVGVGAWGHHWDPMTEAMEERYPD